TEDEAEEKEEEEEEEEGAAIVCNGGWTVTTTVGMVVRRAVFLKASLGLIPVGMDTTWLTTLPLNQRRGRRRRRRSKNADAKQTNKIRKNQGGLRLVRLTKGRAEDADLASSLSLPSLSLPLPSLVRTCIDSGGPKGIECFSIIFWYMTGSPKPLEE
ncbi:hypothetical protein RFI_37104, partial [Reticulomyxa filosa]